MSAQGFRGEGFTTAKPSGELRVLCFGDSRTMGEGLEEAETYAALLQGNLRADGRAGARVLNLGHDGWSSYQGTKLLDTEGLALSPDVAVFSFGINDTDADWGVSDDQRARLMDSAFVSIQRTLYRSMTFYWAQREFLQARGFFFGKRRLGGRRRGQGPNPVPRASPPEYERNLRAFIRLARQHGVLPIVLIIPPNPYYDWSDWASGRSAEVRREKEDFAEAARLRDKGDVESARRLFLSLAPHTVFETLNEVSRRVAFAEGAPLVDMSRVFYEALDREQLYIDDVHPNREGTDLIARALADVILERTAHAAAPPPQR